MTRCGSANLPRRLREFATTTLTLTVLLAAHPAYGHTTRLERVARLVFGPRAAAALCIAHYESTDGARLYNGVNLGPWQVSVAAHPWVDRRRVVSDWLYSARVAYRISDGGRDWSAWATHSKCGL